MISRFYPRACQRYVSLPLFGHVIEEFAEWLKQQDYQDSTIRYKLSVVPHVEAFFAERGTRRLEDLTCGDLEDIWAVFRRERKGACGTARNIKDFLTESQGLKPTVPKALTPICHELDRFGSHLRCVRGLTDTTIRGLNRPDFPGGSIV